MTSVIESLAKFKFDTGNFTHDNTCIICMAEYEAEDDVTPLECDPRHYFHTDCIQDWIKQGKNSCPVCRVPIKEFS